MAKLGARRRFHRYLTSLCMLVIYFGFALSSQVKMEDFLEISEFVEDFQDNPDKYFLKNHDIVRRAAGDVKPNISTSTSPAIPTNPTTLLPTNSSSSTSAGIRSASVKPSERIIPMSKRASLFIVKTTSLSTVKTTSFPSIISKTTSFTTARLTTTITPTSKRKTPTVRTTPVPKPTMTLPSKPATYVEDNHKYYRSQYYINGSQWWFNLDDGSTKATFHKKLSRNEIFSDLFSTSFDFPYYGHVINNVTITNKGYVFLGERLHKFNASAQYAAPLMADFGAEIHDKTSIRYIDTGDRLTVEWANMKLRNQLPDKQFSFQCSILKNGTLIFAYKKIPVPVENIKKNNFFVRVGLSDTFRREFVKRGTVIINNKTYNAVRYIYYYLYDRIQLSKDNVKDGAAFVIIPFPNCVMFNSCDKCLNTQTKFNCKWCPQIKRCSDGIDRHRVKWENAGCLVNSLSSCSSDDSSAISGGEIAVIVIVLVLVIIIVAWFVYAYLHPQTKSGLCLIRYGNPTKWCRNSGGEGQNTSTDGRISFKTMSFESNA